MAGELAGPWWDCDGFLGNLAGFLFLLSRDRGPGKHRWAGAQRGEKFEVTAVGKTPRDCKPWKPADSV